MDFVSKETYKTVTFVCSWGGGGGGGGGRGRLFFAAECFQVGASVFYFLAEVFFFFFLSIFVGQR